MDPQKRDPEQARRELKYMEYAYRGKKYKWIALAFIILFLIYSFINVLNVREKFQAEILKEKEILYNEQFGKDKNIVKKSEITPRKKDEANYYQLEDLFILEIKKSKQNLKFQLALMTYEDVEFFGTLEKNELILRSAIVKKIEGMENFDIANSNDKIELQNNIKNIINDELQKLKIAGEINKVYFTKLIIE